MTNNSNSSESPGMKAFNDASERIGKYRWTICTLVFFATTVNYLDRQVIGILAPMLKEELGIGEADYGYIVMAFQAAYAVGMIIATPHTNTETLEFVVPKSNPITIDNIKPCCFII